METDGWHGRNFVAWKYSCLQFPMSRPGNDVLCLALLGNMMMSGYSCHFRKSYNHAIMQLKVLQSSFYSLTA